MQAWKQSYKNGARYRGNERGGIINRNILQITCKNLDEINT